MISRFLIPLIVVAASAVSAGPLPEVLSTRCSLPGPRPLDRFDPTKPYDLVEPTLTADCFGEGNAIHLSADVGRNYLDNPYPVLKRLATGLVRAVRPPIEVVAPRAIEVTAATRAPGELLVHLINNRTPHTPCDTSLHNIKTHFYLEEVNPIRDIKVIFNDFRIRAATLPLSGVALPVAGAPPPAVLAPKCGCMRSWSRDSPSEAPLPRPPRRSALTPTPSRATIPLTEVKVDGS
jgi:hypothetical protein